MRMECEGRNSWVRLTERCALRTLAELRAGFPAALPSTNGISEQHKQRTAVTGRRAPNAV
jgi:hypothetical protein